MNKDILLDVNNMLGDNILFKELSADGLARGIIYNSNANPLSIVEGVSFNRNHFFSGNRIAVIGKEYCKYITNDGETKLISLPIGDYEVVGIVGNDTDSILDKMIFVNLNSINQERMGIYAIDGLSRIKVQSCYKAVCDYLRKEHIETNEILRESTGIERVLENEKSNMFIFISLIAIIFLSSISITISFYNTNKKIIYVKRLVGYKNIRIFFDMLAHFLTLANLSFLIGLIIYCIYSLFANGTEHILSYIIYSYILLMGFCIFLLSILIIKTQKHNVIELKQRWSI